MSIDLTNPIFSDSDKAREHLEELHWPNGPVCPHCGETKRISKLSGKSHRKGLHQCNNGDCNKPFTVTIGTVMERSKIPLNKWVLGFHLMASAKKGISSHQLHRQLGITYKSAWFLSMRIREAMGLPKEPPAPMGGSGKKVEADETYVGGKARNAHKNKPVPKKHAVVTLVEREGRVHAEHVASVTAQNVRKVLDEQVSKSHI